MVAVVTHDARSLVSTRAISAGLWYTAPGSRRNFFTLPYYLLPPRSSVQASQQYTVSVTQFYQRFQRVDPVALLWRRHHLRQDNYPQEIQRGYKYVYLTPNTHINRETHTHAHTQTDSRFSLFSHFVYIKSAYKLRVYNHKHYCVRPSAPFYKCMTKCMGAFSLGMMATRGARDIRCT